MRTRQNTFVTGPRYEPDCTAATQDARYTCKTSTFKRICVQREYFDAYDAGRKRINSVPCNLGVAAGA